MNKKSLIASLLVLFVFASFVGWFLLREQKMTEESPKPPVVEEYLTQEWTGTPPSSGTDTSKPQEPVDTQSSPKIDTSSWKTYRNEKYGFEFDLPNEYTIPENEKNIVGKKKNANLLDSKQTEYLFNSRQGLEQIKRNAGMSDAGDGWNIRLKTYPYSKLIESNLEEWLKQNGRASFDDAGKRTLKNGSDVAYASWDSICSDYSAFFIRKKYIVEFNTCASSYFSRAHYGGEEDYFSSILNSVRF